MSIRQSAKEFDAAYHRLIHGIAHEDRGEVDGAYLAWLTARSRMADHLMKAHERADVPTINAIDHFIQESVDSLTGDVETLREVYPKYVNARDELFSLTPKDLAALLAKASDFDLDWASFTTGKGFDIKSFLQAFVDRIRVERHHAVI